MDHRIKILYLPHYDRSWGPVGYAKPGDAGFDLRAAIAAPVTIVPGQQAMVPFGVKIALPEHPDPHFVYELQIRSRSGLAAKNGVSIVNSPGTIDAGYRGEIQAILQTLSTPFLVEPGMRIAQGVLSVVPVASFDEVASEAALGETARGAGGFGSTGTGTRLAS